MAYTDWREWEIYTDGIEKATKEQLDAAAGLIVSGDEQKIYNEARPALASNIYVPPSFLSQPGSYSMGATISSIPENPRAPEGKKPRRPRQPSYKKNDKVQTPNGPGNVWSVDRDGIVCVELDSDPSILHEFEKKELKKIK